MTSTLTCSPSSTVISTDQGPLYVYPAPGYGVAQLHIGDTVITMSEPESNVLGVALGVEAERIVPDDEPMPSDYQKAAKSIRDDLRETIKSWGKLDIAGSIHEGNGEAVQDELKGLLRALEATAKALHDVERGWL